MLSSQNQKKEPVVIKVSFEFAPIQEVVQHICILYIEDTKNSIAHYKIFLESKTIEK